MRSEFTDEFYEPDIEAVGQSQQRSKCRIDLAAFDVADERSVHGAPMGQLLLGQPMRSAQLSDAVTDKLLRT